MQEQGNQAGRSFESAFAELEEVVRRLEEGELRLEEVLSLYERGQALARFCQARLDEAELRVTRLATGPEGGGWPADGFQPADDAAC